MPGFLTSAVKVIQSEMGIYYKTELPCKPIHHQAQLCITNLAIKEYKQRIHSLLYNNKSVVLFRNVDAVSKSIENFCPTFVPNFCI